MNIEEIYLDKIWSVVNDGLPEGELMLSGNDQDKVEKTLEEYHQAKLKLLGIANVVDSKPELKAALNHAVSAIYFNDNSDYLSGLYGTVRSLTGLESPTDEDITNLFEKLNPE